MKALILCAGRGTRLGTLTDRLPKPMLAVGGEPLLAHTLRTLVAYGFDHVAVNLHFQGEAIAAHFGDGARFGVSLHYSREERLLGTAGAVRRLAPFFADVEDFLVLYGDLLIDQDLGALVRFHRAQGAAATLLLHQRPGSNSLVRLEDDGRITGFVERPTEEQRRQARYPWVNSGAQILSHRLIARIPEGIAADLPCDVYVPALATERLCGLPLTGYRCAIDSPERLDEARAAFADGRYRRIAARTAGDLRHG